MLDIRILEASSLHTLCVHPQAQGARGINAQATGQQGGSLLPHHGLRFQHPTWDMDTSVAL